MILAGKTLTSVVEGDADPRTLIPHLIELWRSGRLPFDDLIEKFPLAQISAAEQASLTGQVIKPVLVLPT